MKQALFVFLEGRDDERFFELILKPELLKKYNYVKPYQYAQKPGSQIKKFIEIIQKDHDYIFLSDLNSHICYTKKKDYIMSHRAPNIDPAKIAVVKVEIESWYQAGLSKASARALNIVFRENTELVTKELLLGMMQRRFVSKNDFLVEILKKFSLNMAKKHNKSFRYFCNKFL